MREYDVCRNQTHIVRHWLSQIHVHHKEKKKRKKNAKKGTSQVKWTKRRRHPFSTTSTFPFERNPFLTRPFLPFYPSSYRKRQNHIDEQFPLLLFFRFWFCAVAVYRFCCVVLYVFFSNPLP